MLDFRVTYMVPPGGRYFYLVPETNVRLESPTERGLHGELRKHYQANELTLPHNIQQLVRDHMCRHLPSDFCFGSDDGKPRARVITIQQVKDSTNKLIAGNGRVTPGEARRRAEICGDCEHNDHSSCTSCTGVSAWARRMAGADLGSFDQWLGVCAMDATALPATVHMSRVPCDDTYPEHCWRKQS